MSRPLQTPTMTFDDAMTIHVLRAQGLTFRELCELVGDNSGRVTQVLDGTLYPESWQEAVERLSTGRYWHPRIAALVLNMGAEPLIAATRAADPARRRYRQSLKRANKFAIPFRRRHARFNVVGIV